MKLIMIDMYIYIHMMIISIFIKQTSIILNIYVQHTLDVMPICCAVYLADMSPAYIYLKVEVYLSYLFDT